MAARIDEDIDPDASMIETASQLMQPAEDKLESGEKLELGEAGIWVYSTCVHIGAIAINRSDLDQEMVAEGMERAADFIRDLDEDTVASMRSAE